MLAAKDTRGPKSTHRPNLCAQSFGQPLLIKKTLSKTGFGHFWFVLKSEVAVRDKCRMSPFYKASMTVT